MNRNKHVISLIKEKLDPVDTEKLYDDMLDECYGPVTIAGLEYQHSEAQKSIDPIAYRCSVSDFIDSECQNDILEEVDGEYYNKNEVDDLLENI